MTRFLWALLLTGALSACEDSTSNEPRVTQALTNGDLQGPANCFELYTKAFGTDSVVIDGQQRPLRTKEAGLIHLRSGRLIVGDPILLKDLLPYAQELPAGQFTVDLLQAHVSGYWYNTVVRVRFSSNQPISWKIASSNKTTMDTSDVRSDNPPGFSVDAASALLFDEAEQAALLRKEMEQLWSDSIRVTSEFVAFSTGGDGRFPAYFAYDRDGQPCQLIIDLLAIPCSCSLGSSI